MPILFRSGYRRQTSSGAEIQKYRPSLPPGQFGWEVRHWHCWETIRFQSVFRFVLKGVSYNPMDVMNCLMIRRGYKMQGNPQQRSLPNVHNKDDKWGCDCSCSSNSSAEKCWGSGVTILLILALLTTQTQLQSLNEILTPHFRFAFIYHLSKDTPLRRVDTVPGGLAVPGGPSAPPHSMEEPDLTRQASDQKLKSNFK